MKKPIAAANSFFVDESGDPTFFDRYGNLIVGNEGCSPILILGFIESTQPALIRQALADLHRDIAADGYLKDIPSISATNVAFHAKDDAPEVRQSLIVDLYDTVNYPKNWYSRANPFDVQKISPL